MSTSPATNKFTWLVKREFWEYRGSFFWAPIITAMVMIAFVLFGLILTEMTAHQHGVSISGFDVSKITAAMGADDVEKLHSALDVSLLSMSFPIGIVLFFVLFFYCTGTLYNERADRSVLFWKSLPFSDMESVLAKLFAVALVAPVLAVAGMIMLQLGFLILISLYTLFHGINALPLLWSPTHLTSLWFKLIIRIPVNSLWALPSIGWLFLCSSFVRSKPFLWAVMLPVVSGVIVSMMKLMQSFSLESGWYWRHIVGRLLLSLIPGSWMWMDFGPANLAHLGNNPLEMADNFLSLSTLGNELASPDIWIGAVVGVAMIAAAIYFRQRRVEAFV
jgi:ABC-2 type transport system permease protein